MKKKARRSLKAASEALDNAVQSKNVAEVKRLLDAGASPDRLDPSDFPPLWLAACNDDGATIALLLDAGADIRATAFTAETALHVAAHRHCCEAIKVLLHFGAEVDVLDEFGRTPLHYATSQALAQPGHQGDQVARLLLRAGADGHRESHGESAFHRCPQWVTLAAAIRAEQETADLDALIGPATGTATRGVGL